MIEWLVENLARIGAISVVIEAKEAGLIAIDSIDSKCISGRCGASRFSIPFGQEVQLDLEPERIAALCSTRFEGVAHFKLAQPIENRRMGVQDNLLLNDETNWQWSKQELLPLEKCVFTCKECGCALFDDNNCKKWNDMPSEFWAELMDYWHCHKPTLNTATDETSSYYMKYSHLKPANGEILVGSSYFICSPISLSSRTVIDSSVHCKNCSTTIGEITQDKLCQIYKWKLVLNGKSTYNMAKHVISQILNTIDGTSSRHIILEAEGTQKKIYLWIFSIGTSIGTSKFPNTSSSMKILYKRTESEKELLSTVNNTNIEEITTKAETYDAFIDILNEMNTHLPSTVANWNGWKVSYVQI